MINFTIKVADLTVAVTCRYELVKTMCKQYIVEDCEPDIKAFVTDEQIEKEVSSLEGATPEYSEFICIYREIAQRLPEYHRVVFHGASITYKEKGLLFTAPSGTGKSTHIKLWREYLGQDVQIVNGDKPVIGTKDGIVTVYGTPWAGKERWQRNTSARLYGICLLEQGKENRIVRLTNDECITAFMHQIYLPDVPNALGNTLGVLSDIIENLPVYKLTCDISEEAVKTSFEALIGEKYK